MTTEQTAQQLELAAQILRTGHPWKSSPQAPDTDIYSALRDGFEIHPVLATPPDRRPLHNPDNLTAEQVGVGYRLVCYDDKTTEAKLEKWMGGEWVVVYTIGQLSFRHCQSTYRLPLSVPWPEPVDPYAELKAAHAAGKVIEWRFKDGSNQWIAKTANFNEFSSICEYRIKPEPVFQLPLPPPGMQWHREDGWQEGDLPQGWRPLVKGEARLIGDELKDNEWSDVETGDLSGNTREIHCHSRTTRPLLFTHEGHEWTWHRPGDPMPCDGERRVECVFADYELWTDGDLTGRKIAWTSRGDRSEIIGWRYADEKKTVPFDISDVPPCSVLSLNPPRWFDIYGVCKDGIYVLDDEPLVETLWKWDYLLEKVKINRSIPLTGKWNPDTWEPCHKEIDA